MSLVKKFLGLTTFFLFLLLLQFPQHVLAVTNSACDIKLVKVSSTNGDYKLKAVSTCNVSKTFKLSADLPGGKDTTWNAQFSGNKVKNDIVTVAANDNSAFEVKISPPDDANSGERNIIIHAIQTDNSTHKGSLTVTYKVKQNSTSFTPVLTIVIGNRTCADNSVTTPSKLTWTHPSSAATFKVKKGSSANGPFSAVTTTSGFEYTIPTNQNGSYYVVSANNGANSNAVHSIIPDVTQCPAQDCVAHPDICLNGSTCNQTSHQCELPNSNTSLNFAIGLDTIGTTGTNSVSTFASSNKNPKHTSRDMVVNIYDSSNQQVYTDWPASLSYVSNTGDPNYGKFVGIAHLEHDFITGDYRIKVTVPGYLTKEFTGFVHLNKGTINNLNTINLTAGDINGDNTLNIADYNLFISCSIFARTNQAKAACDTNTNYKFLSDINDDGASTTAPNIDQIDYIYFLQEFSVQHGD